LEKQEKQFFSKKDTELEQKKWLVSATSYCRDMRGGEDCMVEPNECKETTVLQKSSTAPFPSPHPSAPVSTFCWHHSEVYNVERKLLIQFSREWEGNVV